METGERRDKVDLTTEQITELDALQETNAALGGPSFLLRFYYDDPIIGPLIQHGYIKWGDPPKGFSKRHFAGTTITNKGRSLLAGLHNDK